MKNVKNRNEINLVKIKINEKEDKINRGRKQIKTERKEK